ncbi:Pectate lyase superfamily protein [Geodermatophilus telluris]|uniref:Pectate lyase superfamily protein n=1 Tax=Geodermatophilus telluris TaxID=1190417 RepID=A0A1G6L902_9ACTN|nr:glycosyl hydrolase family 28-related protein [Geodermatophilus telluris]SDC39016.1 Pectate lyase superfamily protein [Geodermatophilus telluris]
MTSEDRRLSRRRALALGGSAVGGGLLTGHAVSADDVPRPPGPSRTHVDPRDHGAVGDGQVDDTAACQAAIDTAARDGRRVLFPAGVFLVSEALRLPSGIDVGGSRVNTVVQQVTPGRPVMASSNWFHDGGGPGGDVYLHDLTLRGEEGHEESHGIVLRDYYSRLERLTVYSCGGHGVQLTSADENGTPFPGPSLVENRITEVDVRLCHGVGMYLGEPGNGKLTDGYLHHCFLECAVDAAGALAVGSAGGWKIGDVHVYGRIAGPAVEIHHAYDTDLSGIHVEDYSQAAIRLVSMQQSLSMERLIIRGSTSGGHAIEFASLASDVASAGASISNLTVVQDHAVPMTAVHNASPDIHVALGLLTTTGDHGGVVLRSGGPGAGTVVASAGGLRTSGQVGDSANRRTLTYGDRPLALADWVEWSGDAAQRLEIPLPRMDDHTVVPVHVVIAAAGRDDGTVRATYSADIAIASRVNETDDWTVIVIREEQPRGFSTAPEFTCSHEIGTSSGNLAVTFRAEAADSYGSVGLLISHT